MTTVNVNYEIPDELHRLLKMQAAAEGVTLKDLIVRLLAESVEKEAVA